MIVGSRYVAESLWKVIDLPGLRARTRLLPPGVDARRFRPRQPAQARARLHALADRLEGNPGTCDGMPHAVEALRAADPLRDRIVSYAGKLIPAKGVDLLIAAWPLVTSRVPEARLVIAGSGTFEPALRELVRSLGSGDIAGARDIACRGHEFQGEPRGELRYLAVFLDGLRGAERERYVDAGPRAMRRVHFTGLIEHDDIADVMCASEAVVVPSTFPEAFGMVIAEAACCGALPLAAAHSGLREVCAQLAPALGDELSFLLTFAQGPRAVHEIAGKLTTWLTFASDAPAAGRRAREALAELGRSRFGWQQTAEGIVAAAQGRLDDLAAVPERPPG